MDRKDHQIVRALMHDGRLSNQDLAAAVNLCRAAVQEIDPIRTNQVGRALSTPAEREGRDDRG